NDVACELDIVPGRYEPEPGILPRAAMISSLDGLFLSVALTKCICMSVVGTFMAAVSMLIWGITVCTSGPWCDGILMGSGTMPFIGPRLASLGSPPLLTSVTRAFCIPKALSIAKRSLHNPVVLQETTRTYFLPMAWS